jgi:hypothetical protein
MFHSLNPVCFTVNRCSDISTFPINPTKPFAMAMDPVGQPDSTDGGSTHRPWKQAQGFDERFANSGDHGLCPPFAQYRFDVFPGDFKMQNPKRPTCKKYTQQ